jgi:hypothetical protein
MLSGDEVRPGFFLTSAFQPPDTPFLEAIVDRVSPRFTT